MMSKRGLVKFDFSGPANVTIIDWVVRDINEQRAGSGEARWT